MKYTVKEHLKFLLVLQHLYKFLSHTNAVTTLSLAGTECPLESVSDILIFLDFSTFTLLVLCLLIEGCRISALTITALARYGINHQSQFKETSAWYVNVLVKTMYLDMQQLL